MPPIIAIIRALRGLLRLPNIEDETAFREACQRIIDAAIRLASLTPTQLDDALARAASMIVGNDALWEMFYRLLRMTAGESDLDDLAAVSGAAADDVVGLRDVLRDLCDHEVP